MFKELRDEKQGLIHMVTALNMVQRKGKVNVNIMDVEEDDDVDE